ncbi:zinc finger BED domain-containing protein RICESLEEPER 2, partial [Tanacetum coccineum]
MDQQNPQQNTPYESISSSMPTYESFSSQQNITIEGCEIRDLGLTMKSEIIGYGFKHLIENGCMPMEQDEEDSQETPFQFLTPDELCAKFVEKVEKAMGLFRRGNAFINSFKDKVGNKLSGCEDELKKYLKELRLELEDDEDLDILTWWKINSPRFPIVSRMAK